MNLQTKQWTVAPRLVPVLSILIIFGAAFYSLAFSNLNSEELNEFSNSKVILEGLVVRDPDIRDKTIRLTVKPEKINGVAVGNKASMVLVSVDRFSVVSYGDSIKVNSVLREPNSFETDSGRTFNYPKFLETHGISHEMPFSNIEVQSSGHGNVVISSLFIYKNIF